MASMFFWKRESAFEKLVVSTVKEEAPANSGTNIVDSTVGDYGKLVRQFLQGTPESLLSEKRVKPALSLLEDPVRTVIMLRAVSRIIRQKTRDACGPVCAIEAGHGSGFIAAAMAAMHKDVEVFAYDDSEGCVDLLEHRAKALGLKDRVNVECRNLLSNPVVKSADVVVAEHLTRGCFSEHSTAIPRNVRGPDPTVFVPYAVRPRVFISDKSIDGQEVALADRGMTEVFHVDGPVKIDPGPHYIEVANDIRWLSPRFDRAEEFLERVDGWQKAGKSRSDLAKPAVFGNVLQGMMTAIANQSDASVSTDFEMSYPFGVLALGRRVNHLIHILTSHPATEIWYVQMPPKK